MGFIGGFFGFIIQIVGILLMPFGLIDFVINYSSKKEEISMHIGSSKDGPTSKTIKNFEFLEC